jgi:hypothetical protein
LLFAPKHGYIIADEFEQHLTGEAHDWLIWIIVDRLTAPALTTLVANF